MIEPMTESIWVPWLNACELDPSDGRYIDPSTAPSSYMWISDVPYGLGKHVVAGHLDDKVGDERLKACTHCNIMVSVNTKKECENAVAYSAVPLKTRMLIDMNDACRANWDGNTEAYFATIPNLSTGNAATKTAAKECVEQARARGLSAAKAEKIRSDYDLPPLASISG